MEETRGPSNPWVGLNEVRDPKKKLNQPTLNSTATAQLPANAGLVVWQKEHAS